MAKSELMRPSWIALNLCNSDTIAATMLVEIMFRANVTKYGDPNNLIIVFSLQEWSDNTGLSIGQVRKSLKRLTDINLIKTYNKKHPHKSVLRALHVEVSYLLHALWQALTKFGYKFDTDILFLESEHIKSGLNVAKCSHNKIHNADTITEHTNNTHVCIEETNLSIYKKKNNKELKAEAPNGTSEKIQFQNKIEEEDIEEEDILYENTDDNEDSIPSFLKEIKTLPAMLIALHKHYVNYFWKVIPNQNQLAGYAYDSHILWVTTVNEYYGEDTLRVPNDIETGLFILMHHELGDKTDCLIKKVIANWNKFIQFVKARNNVYKVPKLPDISFFYYYRQCAMNLNA